MKEKIINFIKFKFSNYLSFFNEKISLEARFTILATYIIIALYSLSYFLIILFFAFIYFDIWNLLKSKPNEIGEIFKTALTPIIDHFDSDLTLNGLLIIYNLNQNIHKSIKSKI